MPGWPTVGRTDDQQLVETLRRADTTAPASLYDSYAERLHDYAHSLLGDRESAAGAVHDALVTAQGHVDRLRDPGRLRAWLYALVRVRCAGAELGGPRGAAAPLDVHDDPGERELAALVHEAMAELGGQEREVLELSLRHDLGGGEVGAVLGLTSRQVAARLCRARDHLENAAAAVVLAKVGRAHCPDLSAMVDSWEGPLTTILRRRLSAHIGRCEVCVERRDRHVSAGRLLDLVPLAYPPLSLRRRVIETCLNPELREERASVVARGDHFDRTGFPAEGQRSPGRRRAGRKESAGGRARDQRGRGTVQAASPTGNAAGARSRRTATPPDGVGRRTEVLPAQRRRQRRRRGPVLLLAAACVLAATGAVVAVGGPDLAGGALGNAQAAPGTEPALITLEPGPEPTPDLPEEPESAGPETESAPTPTPRRTRATGTPVPAPTATRPAPTRRSSAGPARTTTPPPAAGRLTVSCPSDIGEGAGQIQLAARNAALSWSATTSGGLDVHPAQGRLKAGARAVIWVTARDPSESGAGRVAFRSAGGNTGCAISWENPETDASAPPPDPAPDPTPDPSAGASSEGETG
ncbi:sigma-70 family RNA polymerase sigma factor [Streptosporangium amethystogenes]|uniref:sigma-70 family RNA polymerase sigma factor n=1 Tax=Streptosporangium amethystogenes TaxID=2002 RepID=UPI000B2147C1|nr:sigma-70 family RNA polymerase sigma factor [Streptosporangium amethystogenes]